MRLWWTVWVMLLVAMLGCTPERDIFPERDRPLFFERDRPLFVEWRPGVVPPLSEDVAFELEANARVVVGDNLDLRLRVVNHSDTPVVLVQPLIWSWARGQSFPRYDLEWTDGLGAPVRDPLGFGPKGGCGSGEGARIHDLVLVRSGWFAGIHDKFAPNNDLEVQPTARPGVYSLRVRYLSLGIEHATPLQLLSNAVAVEIVDGDEQMWRCRVEQLEGDSWDRPDQFEWPASCP